jgi:hypothetical protein
MVEYVKGSDLIERGLEPAEAYFNRAGDITLFDFICKLLDSVICVLDRTVLATLLITKTASLPEGTI